MHPHIEIADEHDRRTHTYFHARIPFIHSFVNTQLKIYQAEFSRAQLPTGYWHSPTEFHGICVYFFPSFIGGCELGCESFDGLKYAYASELYDCSQNQKQTVIPLAYTVDIVPFRVGFKCRLRHQSAV